MALAEAFLGTIGVDQATINKIKAMLDESADSINGHRPGEVVGGAFGASGAGQDLDLQTSTAHRHVVEAIEEMVAGMTGFRVNVTKFETDMVVTDDDNGAMLDNLRQIESCTTPTDFRANASANVCTPATAAAGGDA